MDWRVGALLSLHHHPSLCEPSESIPCVHCQDVCELYGLCLRADIFHLYIPPVIPGDIFNSGCNIGPVKVESQGRVRYLQLPGFSRILDASLQMGRRSSFCRVSFWQQSWWKRRHCSSSCNAKTVIIKPSKMRKWPRQKCQQTSPS